MREKVFVQTKINNLLAVVLYVFFSIQVPVIVTAFFILNHAVVVAVDGDAEGEGEGEEDPPTCEELCDLEGPAGAFGWLACDPDNPDQQCACTKPYSPPTPTPTPTPPGATPTPTLTITPTLTPSPTPPNCDDTIKRQCGIVHEMVHAQQIEDGAEWTCITDPGKDYGYIGMKDRAAKECPAILAELQCLKQRGLYVVDNGGQSFGCEYDGDYIKLLNDLIGRINSLIAWMGSSDLNCPNVPTPLPTLSPTPSPTP